MRAGCFASFVFLVIVVWLFFVMPQFGVQFVIMVFPDHTHYFLYASYISGLLLDPCILPTECLLHTANSTCNNSTCECDVGFKINNSSKSCLKSKFIFVSYASCWCVSCAVVSVPCSLVVTCWESADLLAVVFVVFCLFPKCFLVHIRKKGEVGAMKLG